MAHRAKDVSSGDFTQEPAGVLYDGTTIGVEKSHKSTSEHDLEKQGLFNARAMMFLILWYIFSAFTLFLNKYILTTLKGEPTLLGTTQMLSTLVYGFIQLNLPCSVNKGLHRGEKPANFLKNMTLVGFMRCGTVVLGLVALKLEAVSFTETVKSSAPIFTVFVARVVLGEVTGLVVMASLIPIMIGLALCSAYELSFNMVGFIAVLATVLIECFQNVYSKKLISADKFKYTPLELQFYTSLASVVVQIPACAFLMDLDLAKKAMNHNMMIALLFDGVFFHFQSLTAYALMGYISPITHSVCNTVKRAFLIWSSVLLFGNPVTILSGLGTIVVTIGVFMYNKAREYDETYKEVRLSWKQNEPVRVHKV